MIASALAPAALKAANPRAMTVVRNPVHPRVMRITSSSILNVALKPFIDVEPGHHRSTARPGLWNAAGPAASVDGPDGFRIPRRPNSADADRNHGKADVHQEVCNSSSQQRPEPRPNPRAKTRGSWGEIQRRWESKDPASMPDHSMFGLGFRHARNLGANRTGREDNPTPRACKPQLRRTRPFFLEFFARSADHAHAGLENQGFLAPDLDFERLRRP